MFSVVKYIFKNLININAFIMIKDGVSNVWQCQWRWRKLLISFGLEQLKCFILFLEHERQLLWMVWQVNER